MDDVLPEWTGGHDWLKVLESPFAWQPTELLPSDDRHQMLPKLRHREQVLHREHKNVFTFNSFVVRLLLGYELYVTGQISSAAFLKLDHLEKDLHQLDIISNNSFFREVRRAQWHVALSTRAILLAKTGRLEESKRFVESNIDHVSSFTPEEVGGLYGIRSACYLEYGPKGSKDALHWALEAIKISPKQPEWHTLAGTAKGAIRVCLGNNSGIPYDELVYFEKAMELSPLPVHGFHLARVYEDIVRGVITDKGKDKDFKTTPIYKELGDISRKTVKIYQKILHSGENSTKIQVRCLEGLLKLPRQFLNEDELRDLVDKLTLLEKKTKKFYNVAATYYLKIKKDHRTALQFFEEGAIKGDFACSINEVRLRIKLGIETDAETVLLNIVERFQNDSKSLEGILAHLTSFYLFINHDINYAVDTIIKLLEINPRSKAMLSHKPIFVRTIRPMNLLVVVLNQVRTADVLPLQVPTNNRLKGYFMRLIDRYYPKLMHTKVDITMMDRIHDESVRLDPVLRRRMKKRERPEFYK